MTASDGSEPRVLQWIRSNPLSWFKWGNYASGLCICFPKLIEIALVARAAGSPRLLAPIKCEMSQLYLGRSSRMRAPPRRLHTLSRQAIEEHRHMPSRYPEPDWQTFCAQPHCAGANNSVSISHQHMSNIQNIITLTVFDFKSFYFSKYAQHFRTSWLNE